ncbi:acetyl/propionyl/methylcrotonyl-CoA carboxylase subunit alpha [Comamonas kerstersii]|uniref:acetyl/propionyl/methylcrotonyl-CoA carboxylase subunit alpha n=1 Tax=Comamonas kerstersii TaxID=225992 RepID=UPI00098624E8|nr:biotin carboxylase N-terminal domain-containing protein [Comamonas kerstersii]OOH88572.1 acetyl/propionyl-CoA carboxylase subuit alpha [Comamonas kerstersii]OOH95726.1 acetyl/propionyl-CoA carboxylase subuit alpha [Comamonas kerstersii]
MRKVLIANRGEIAVRVARACRDYGVASVAVYADPDADALHVRAADEAWALHGVRPADTYLDIAKLLDIARRSGADAVHPGYGFLSERAEFARAVMQAGLTWIGPRPETIEALGDKVAARKIARQVGAPLVAGTAEPVQSAEEVMAFARAHGLPIAIKAAFGGGGRGLKVAWKMEEVAELYDSAVREATAAFGRGECFVEQFLDRPRHIEAQVLADQHGQVVVLGTRDCSLQRRNQKLVEEAPAPFLTDAQRTSIHRAAQAICAAAGYVSAGTVEFLLSRTGQISFLEVNTRLQVEHPVTEETTGVDLVVEQLRIADGLPLSLTETPVPRGHSIEFRINAEDPGRGYLPTPGRIEHFAAPSGPGVRLDSGVAAGSVIPGSFDSLMAKLIVSGATREQALQRARRALAEFQIEGVASVLPFHRAVVQDPAFTAEQGFGVHTRWIETEMQQHWLPAPRPDAVAETPLQRCYMEIDGKRVRLGLPALLLPGLSAAGGVAAPVAGQLASAGALQPGEVAAPMAGSLVAWKVDDGAQVAEGAVLALMEAMKMETAITATASGTLQQVATAGALLQAGQVVARITTG